MTSNDKQLKVALDFLGRKRPGFDQEWGQAMTEKVRACTSKMDFEFFEPPEKVTDDVSLREGLAACNAAGADVLLTLQTTMADARMAPTLSRLWPHPVLLWATPEKQEGDMISSCSLVGVHAWGSVLQQHGSPFEIVYGDPEAGDTVKQLQQAVRLAYTARKLQAARVGIIGGTAPGYFAMSADPFDVMRGLGAQAQYYSLMQFADVVNEFSGAEVAEDVAKVKALGIPMKDVEEDVLPMASRLYLAMRHFLKDEEIDALAVRCWPEMPNTFGQWPYFSMVRLAGEGEAVACEGDADGALSLLVGECLGLGAGYLSDWLEHDAETVTLGHGGVAPMSLTPPAGEQGGPQIARHFNNKKPAVMESTLKEGMDITMMRAWRRGGQYFLTAGEAQTIKPKRHLMGSNGLARLTDHVPAEWFDSLCHAGMPHHVIVFRGHEADLFRKLARTMGITWVP